MLSGEMRLVECDWLDRADTAAWLVETARSMGIDTRTIQTRNAGFLVPAELVEGVVPADTSTSHPLGADVVTLIPGAKVPSEVGYSTEAPKLADMADLDLIPDPKVRAEVDRETVRAWAVEQGIEVAAVGRLKATVYDAYKLAHS